jgi:tetratricopeptide (TPR) repeat protein
MDAYEFDLGPWRRQITTSSPEAQTWFNRGLNWTYAYNQEEAVACFKRAIKHDPGCAMAWWGIAYAAGPFYNRPWLRFTDAEIAETLPVCHEAAGKALSLLGGSNTAEQALIDAVQYRYARKSETDRAILDGWHRDFTARMRSAYTAHPDDLDIAALFSEAAVTCTPRRLWLLSKGVPNPASLAEEALVVLERAMAHVEATGVPHPGVLHMYIHALEMSPFPERALRAADMLRGYAPDAGHLEHMAGHIYIVCGEYAQAVEQSRRAIAADDKYLAYAGANNFYTTARSHDFHLCMYAAMFLGQYRVALAAAERIITTATPDLIAASPPFMASILDGYAAMKTHVQVRFGQWQDLTVEPPPPHPERTPIRAAMHAYGKGVAHAALGEIAKAEAAQADFAAAVALIPEKMIFLSNPVHEMLAVGAAMLDGELSYHKGNHAQGFSALREAIARDDALNYTEPWAWMHPPRHALGALLAEQGHFDEAEIVYRQDLGYDNTLARCCQHPDNVWALHGLLECVRRKGMDAEAGLLAQRLALAQSRTDVPIRAACCCRGSGRG